MKEFINLGAITYVIICILQAIVFPPSFLSSLDNVFFIFALLNILLINIEEKEWRFITLTFLLFFSWSVASDLFNHGYAMMSNITYLFYFLKWPAILVTVLDFAKRGSVIYRMRYFVDGLLFFVISINLFLVFNPFGYGEFLQNVFTPKPYSNFVFFNEFQNFRLIGTQMNSNDNAVILSLFYFYYLMIDSKKWYFILILGVLIVLTQSRTVFILTVVLTMLFLFFSLKNRMSNMRFMLSSMFVGVLLSIIVLSSGNLRSLFNGEAFRSNSLMVRLENLSSALSFDGNSLLLGRGTILNPIDTLGVYIDSEYVRVILQYGFIGMAFWVLIAVAILKQFKLRSMNFSYWLVLMTFVFGVSLTNFTFSHGGLGVVIVFFMGLTFCSSEDELTTQ
ncbi:MAG: O-antigen ligase family protein [Flavobacteriales bacterium]|nr:O-antigen ligase family protein [Flavobacteriales bacterium]